MELTCQLIADERIVPGSTRHRRKFDAPFFLTNHCACIKFIGCSEKWIKSLSLAVLCVFHAEGHIEVLIQSDVQSVQIFE